MRAPTTPKKNDVLRPMKPADGVIKTSPAMAPMNVESSDHLPVSKYVMDAQVIAPAEAQRFVTHIAITDLKFRLSVVPASKASQEFQMMTSARSWDMVLWGRCSAKCEGVRVDDLRDRKIGYDKNRLIAVAVAPLHMWTGVPPAKSNTPSSPSKLYLTRPYAPMDNI
jgi:hypothetical protein